MKVTEQSQRFLDLLSRQPSKWFTRSELARLVGKRRLNPYDVAAIELLYEQGLVERQSQEKEGILNFKWVYRAKDVAR